MRALIVEDDYTCGLLLQELLRPYGECQVVGDGLAGLAAFEKSRKDQNPYDLICLDIMMPGMDGQQVLHEIRRIEDSYPVGQKHLVKIVMTTALTDKFNVFKAFREQCDAYLPKPILKEKLDEILAGFHLMKIS